MARAGYCTWFLDRQDRYGSAGAASWNLGDERAGGTFDLGPAAPATWQVVVGRAPL